MQTLPPVQSALVLHEAAAAEVVASPSMMSWTGTARLRLVIVMRENAAVMRLVECMLSKLLMRMGFRNDGLDLLAGVEVVAQVA